MNNTATKSIRRAVAYLGACGVALATLTLAPTAQARSDIYWSVGIGSPGVEVGVSNAYPVYTAPPVYVQPPPVYLQPRPVYAAPPVYYAPPPVYYAPPPVYYAPPIVRPPIVVRPAPVYPIGWAPRGYHRSHGQHRYDRHDRRHGHGRDHGWRY